MKTGRRRLLRRILAALGLGAAGGAAALAFAPLPVGWLVNRLSPDSRELRVRVETATLRLRPFGEGPTLEARGLAIDRDGRPFVRLARLDLLAAKSALAGGRIAATAHASLLELTLPAPDADPGKSAAGASLPDLPGLLADIHARLAADPRAVTIAVRDIRIVVPAGALPEGVAAPSLAGVELVAGPRVGGGLAARVEIRFPDPRAPAPVLGLDVAADHRSAEARAEVPAGDISSLSSLFASGLPTIVRGRLAVRARSELDLVSLKPRAMDVEIEGDELRFAESAPIAPPPAALRLHLRSNETFEKISAQRFELNAPGLEFSLPRLEIDLPAAGGEARLAWELRFSAEPARIWPGGWKQGLPDLSPGLAAIAGELTGARAVGAGTATLRRGPSGWHIGQAAADQTLTAELGPTSVNVAFDAHQRAPAAPIELSLRVPELNPAAGRAEDDVSPLAALNSIFGLEASARVTPDLRLEEARLRCTAGPGKLRPRSVFSVLGRELAFSRAELDVSSRGGRDLRLEKAGFSAGDTRVSLDGSSAELRDDGRVSVELRLSAAAPRLEAWSAWLPAAAGEALAATRWKPAELGIDDLNVKASATLDPADLEKGLFSLEGEAAFRVGEQPVPLRWTAAREQTAAPVAFSLRLPRLAPGAWPGGPGPDLAWSDFRLPLSLEAEGRLEPPVFSPHARVKVRGGPGAVVLPASRAPGREVVAVREIAVDAVVAGDPWKIEVPEARLRLGEDLDLQATRLDVDLHGSPKLRGGLALAPLDLAAVLAAWPAKIEPELRARVAEHLRGGRLAGLAAAFDVEFPAGAAPLVQKAEVDLALRDLSAAAPFLAAPVTVRRADMLLRWPRATARVEGLDLPGVAISGFGVELADLTASTWAVSARAGYTSELAALPAELGLPRGLAGRVTGDIAAEAKLRPETGLVDEITFSVRAAATALDVPGLVAGEAKGAFGGGISEGRHVKLEGLADGSRLAWRLPELAGLAMPAELRVKVAAELDRARQGPMRADLALSAPDLLGRSFALSAAAEWADGRPALPAKVELTELAWGRSRVSGELVETAEGPRATLRSPLIVVPEIVAVARPRLGAMPPSAAPAAAGGAPTADVAPWPLASLAAEVKVERVELGENRSLQGVALAFACDGEGVPRRGSLSAVEGERNRLLATLETKPESRDRLLELMVDDVPRWAAAAAAPLRAPQPPPKPGLGEFEAVLGVALGNLDTITGLLAGGSLEASAVLPENQKPPRLQAVVAVRNATVLRAPRIVQMLALKSGRQLERRPLLREFSVQSLALRDGLVEVAGVKLDGTGLIDRLKIGKGSYALDGGAIVVDGTYFGIGFEVDGTRAKPDVWLKDNLLIRAIGQSSELDFGE